MGTQQLKRIAIVGCCGSGKSTLAHEISHRTGLPIVHLDQLYWQRNWTQRPKDDFINLHDKKLAQTNWIFDGNNSSTMVKRFQAADMVIVMDYPRWLSYWRLLMRTIKYHGQTRDDMTENCPERIDFNFLKYVWGFHKTTRIKIQNALAQTNTQVVYLKSRKQTRYFLDSF